jgi:CheY-like chemotaxis protein
MLEEVPTQGHTTVVYIEADRSNALVMQCLLGSRINYTLHHATDGLSGLDLCRRVGPDLVITEMYLPDITAYELLRALRDFPGTKGVPCIVLSGDAMPAHLERALANGFDDYWTKPIDIWQLMQNIEDAAAGASLSLHRQRSASKTTACTAKASRPGNRSGAALQSDWLLA